MRRSWLRPGFLASLLLSLTLSLGCAWKGHVEKGDAFMAAANFDAAAQEYAEALRLRPDDAEIAGKLAEAQSGQVELRAKAARAALDDGRDRQAIALAAEAYAILPNHPTTAALIDQVVEVAGGRAKEKVAAGQFAEAMAIYDDILAGLPSVRDRVSADAGAAAEAWIAHLGSVAAEAEAAGHPVTALLYRSKIIDLGGGGEAEFAAAREALFAQRRYVVVVEAKAKDPGAAAVADALMGNHAPALLEVVSAAEAPAAATLSIKIGKPKFSTDKQQRDESVQYQSGTKQVPNPFYKMAQDDVLDEERRLVERENEVSKQEQYVDQYSADVAREGDTPGVTTGAEQNLSNAQSRLEAARRAVGDQRNAVIRAKEKAASTAETTEEAVYSTHTYKISTHTLTATVAVEAKLTHGDGRPPLTLSQPLSLSASDDTHGAQDVAGIGENPLDLPSNDELAGQLHGQAAPLVGQLIAESFAGHRQGLRAQADAASDPGEKLEALLAYVITDAGSTDPQVVADVLTLSGVPDVTLLLTRGL